MSDGLPKLKRWPRKICKRVCNNCLLRKLRESVTPYHDISCESSRKQLCCDCCSQKLKLRCERFAKDHSERSCDFNGIPKGFLHSSINTPCINFVTFPWCFTKQKGHFSHFGCPAANWTFVPENGSSQI